jgi:hypothetical protein
MTQSRQLTYSIYGNEWRNRNDRAERGSCSKGRTFKSHVGKRLPKRALYCFSLVPSGTLHCIRRRSHPFIQIRSPHRPANVQNTELCCAFFRTGHCSGRRQHSGSLLRDLGATALIIVEDGGEGGTDWLSTPLLPSGPTFGNELMCTLTSTTSYCIYSLRHLKRMHYIAIAAVLYLLKL